MQHDVTAAIRKWLWIGQETLSGLLPYRWHEFTCPSCCGLRRAIRRGEWP